jgi:hypothetical protein
MLNPKDTAETIAQDHEGYVLKMWGGTWLAGPWLPLLPWQQQFYGVGMAPQGYACIALTLWHGMQPVATWYEWDTGWPRHSWLRRMGAVVLNMMVRAHKNKVLVDYSPFVH